MTTALIAQPIGRDAGELDAVTFDSRLPKSGDITVDFSSDGGDMVEGLSIYDRLRRHAGTVTTRCLGGAFSIASTAFMGGSVREMAENAMLMIHNGSAVLQGTASDLRKEATVLEKFNDRMVAIYANTTGLSTSRIKSMLDAETWLTAQEALELGFATKIIPSVSMAASLNPERFPSFRASQTRWSATSRHESAVLAEIKKGATRRKANQCVAAEHPQLREDMVAEENIRHRRRQADRERQGAPTKAARAWTKAIRSAKESGLSHRDAVRHVQERRPKLHRAFVAAANRTDGSPCSDQQGNPSGQRERSRRDENREPTQDSWIEAVSAAKESGLSHRDAVRHVQKNRPELHNAFVSASNG